MGYAYLSKGKKQGYKILIDEAMDISAVPGEKFFPGTEAVTADGATRFRLNNAHEWVEVAGDTPGGGLPEVSGSGKALVSVNGEWVEQDGYGYTEAGEQSVITWDGNTEDIEHVGPAYKVSDLTPTREMLSGATIEFTSTVTQEKNTVEVSTIEEPMPGLLSVDSSIYIATDDIAEAEMQKGTYFFKKDAPDNMYVSALTYGTPDTVHKIDSKYLPEVGGGDFIIEGTASMVESPMPILLIEDLSKTYAETKAAYLSGKTVKVKIDMPNMVFFSNAIGYQSFDGAEGIQFDGSAFQATAGGFESTKSYISFALEAG